MQAKTPAIITNGRRNAAARYVYSLVFMRSHVRRKKFLFSFMVFCSMLIFYLAKIVYMILVEFDNIKSHRCTDILPSVS